MHRPWTRLLVPKLFGVVLLSSSATPPLFGQVHHTTGGVGLQVHGGMYVPGQGMMGTPATPVHGGMLVPGQGMMGTMGEPVHGGILVPGQGVLPYSGAMAPLPFGTTLAPNNGFAAVPSLAGRPPVESIAPSQVDYPMDLTLSYVAGRPRLDVKWGRGNVLGWEWRAGLTRAQLQQLTELRSAQGCSVRDIRGYVDGKDVRYGVIFTRGESTVWDSRINLDPKQFLKRVQSLGSQGYRPSRISAFQLNGRTYYCDLWERGGPPVSWNIRVGLTDDQLKRANDSMIQGGYSTYKLTSHQESGDNFYECIWYNKVLP